MQQIPQVERCLMPGSHQPPSIRPINSVRTRLQPQSETPPMKKSTLLCIAALLAPTIVGAQIIVNDSWEDEDLAKTGETDADWWSSSSAGGNSIEVATEGGGDMGLVTGTSGRGIHATFTPQMLAVGDTLVTTAIFTTPATVGTDRTTAFKIALMDFNDEGLAASLTANSANPQPLYFELPGYMVDFDVNVSDSTENVTIRKHTVPNESGRFLGTVSEWESLSGSDDEAGGYKILPNTEYVAVFSLTRTGSGMEIFASLSQEGTILDSHTATDEGEVANNIGMLGYWVNSRTFGSTNGADPDNGITFSNVSIELNPIPQPGPNISVFPRKRLGELDTSTTTVSDIVTVRNTGTENALTISEVAFTGDDGAFFTVDEAPTTIPANGSAEIKFTFAPNGNTGAFSSNLEIKSDDVDAEDQTINVEVTATIINLLGPVAHYNLNEAEGTVMNDVTGFDRNGEFDDVMLGQEGLATGTSGGFADGSVASVPVSAFGDDPFTNFSISAWFNGDDFDGLRTLFGQGLGSPPSYALVASGTELQWFVGEGPEFTGGTIAVGTTHHTVVTYASDKATIYLDGVEVASMDSPSELDLAVEDTFYIGSFGRVLPFSGRIDDVQIYDRVISADDVAALFNDPGTVLSSGGEDPEPEPGPTGPGIVVNDSWEDEDRAKTGELDADWWSSSSAGGNSIEVATEGGGDLGLVTGTSGRGIHATFSPAILAVGDTLIATATFTTPATVGTDRSGAFKMALVDFNDAGLAADLTSSSSNVNPLYTSLPGYMVDFDVNKADSTENAVIRKHTVPNESGRFLGTTSEWDSLGGSDEEAGGYKFLPNTEYLAVMSLTRTGDDSMEVFASLSQGGTELDSHIVVDEQAIANNIGMLGFWANSNTFGSTNGVDPDNGITFSNVMIEVKGEAAPAGDWVAVHDFDSLDEGPLDGFGGWVSADPGTSIGSEDGNKVLESVGAGQNAYVSLGGTIPTGSTGTVFFRARTGETPDFVLGVSDVAEPNAWDHFEGYMRFSGTSIDVRDGGGFAAVVENFSADTWYNIWLVLDNDALVTTLYYSTGDEPAQLGGMGAFRMSGGNTEHGELINFLVRTGNAHTTGQLDDIFLASGENLTIPGSDGPGPGGWSVTADFEGLGAGTVNEQGGWVSSAPDTTLVVSDGGNQALEVTGGGQNAYVPLPVAIPSGTTGTVYFRARPGDMPDFVLGTSDVANPDAWDHYEGYMRFAGTNIDVRDGGGFAAAVENFSVDTWYNIWLVVDNTALETTLYYSTGDEPAQLGATGAFRMSGGNTEHGDLINFLVRTGNAHTTGLVDDIYVDASGENLTIPPAVLDGMTIVDVPEIIAVSRSATGVSLTLPAGTTFDIEYSADLITWVSVATDVTGSYEDTDAGRAGAASGFYRGVVK